jgi:hypothetical protein
MALAPQITAKEQGVGGSDVPAENGLIEAACLGDKTDSDSRLR